VVIEGMAAGVPVIGSDHGGIGEAVEHDRTGFLVPPGDPQAIATAVRRLLGDPGLRRCMGLAAQMAATEHFNAVAQSRFLEDTLLAVSHSRVA
jgi:glycosyltransferase involved in cell wall biosynthesis